MIGENCFKWFDWLCVLVFKLCVELNVIFVSWLLFSGIVVVFLKLVFMKLKMNKI